MILSNPNLIPLYENKLYNNNLSKYLEETNKINNSSDNKHLGVNNILKMTNYLEEQNNSFNKKKLDAKIGRAHV